MTPERNIKINPAGNDERARSLITLIDNLIAIVNEENVELAKGLPASRLKQVDEKNRLASLFEQCVAEAVGKAANLNVQDRVLREQLLDRILKLRVAMDENVMRLRAAIDARGLGDEPKPRASRSNCSIMHCTSKVCRCASPSVATTR